NGEEKSVAEALSDLDISPDVFLHNQRHPQRDGNAKWKLSDLFIGELGAPFYIQ
ncbi:15415_t:CDS:1, partial [Racocetra fulgida]